MNHLAMVHIICLCSVEVSLFAFLGEIVDLVRVAESPAVFFAEHGRLLVWMAFVAVVARPVVFGLHVLLVNQTTSSKN